MRPFLHRRLGLSMASSPLLSSSSSSSSSSLVDSSPSIKLCSFSSDPAFFAPSRCSLCSSSPPRPHHFFNFSDARSHLQKQRRHSLSSSSSDSWSSALAAFQFAVRGGFHIPSRDVAIDSGSCGRIRRCGRNGACVMAKVFSTSLASSPSKLTTTDTPGHSVTWGIMQNDKQTSAAREEVFEYLRSEGIDATELTDVELPSSVEVVQERIEFLRKIGLDKEAINNYPLMISCSVKKNMIPVLDYLEKLGITSKDLPSFLERYPMVLHASVVIDLMPVLDYLQGLDIQQKDIASVLTRFPDVLGFRLEGTMSTSTAYLVSIGVKTRAIGPMLTAYPEILGMRVAKVIKPKVEYLVSLGVPKSIVPRLLEQRPQLLGYDLDDTMRPAVDNLLKAGVREEAIAGIITQYPEILGQHIGKKLIEKTQWLIEQVKVAAGDVPTILEKLPQVVFIKAPLAMERIKFLESAGFSADDVAKMVTDCPQLLAISIDKALKPSLNFLRLDMKRPIREVVDFPSYFTYNLTTRIQPRYKRIARKGIECSLAWFLNCSDQKFEERLDADYVDDEDSGPIFQMGGPLSLGDEQGYHTEKEIRVASLQQQGQRKVDKFKSETLHQQGWDSADEDMYDDEEEGYHSKKEIQAVSLQRQGQRKVDKFKSETSHRQGWDSEDEKGYESDDAGHSRVRGQGGEDEDEDEVDMSESASEFGESEDEFSEEEFGEDYEEEDEEETDEAPDHKVSRF